MITDDRFIKFFNRLMKYEGGYVNDPDDPGGETKFGISKRAFPDEDIANLSEGRAMQIYYEDYYKKVNADKLPERIAWQVFDFGVNAGVARSARMVQRLVGAYPDGKIGPTTIALVNRYKEEFPLHILFMSARIRHYLDLTEKNIRNMKYLRGWLLRALEA
jgi:lysozyme family protein